MGVIAARYVNPFGIEVKHFDGVWVISPTRRFNLRPIQPDQLPVCCDSDGRKAMPRSCVKAPLWHAPMLALLISRCRAAAQSSPAQSFPALAPPVPQLPADATAAEVYSWGQIAAG